MGKKERRIEILKDVLKQLKTEKYITKQRCYVNLPKELETKKYEEPEADAKTALLSCTQACKVCAKGAIFLSTVRKENNVIMEDLDWTENWGEKEGTTKTIALFGKANLNKIEAAFEKWTWFNKDNSDGDEFYTSAKCWCTVRKDEGIVKFIKKYPNKTDRLVAIVRNAIRNEGIFKP